MMEPETFLGQPLAWWLDECTHHPHAMMGVMLPASWAGAVHDLYDHQQQSLWLSRCRMTPDQVVNQQRRYQAKHDPRFVNPASLDNLLRLAYDKGPRKERPMMQQPDQPRQDFDSSSTESITFEQNSKGTNVKVRVIKQPGQSDEDWIARIAYIYRSAQAKAAGF